LILSDAFHNQLIAALPEAELARWLPHLEPADMLLGAVIYESGCEMTHMYFPTTSIVSLLYAMESGASAEIAVAGHEGVVGLPLIMGGGSKPSRALVQSAGEGFRLGANLTASLYPESDHSDGADGGMQSSPFTRPAIVQMAVAKPGSSGFERIGNDAGGTKPGLSITAVAVSLC
jgi:hypothetical protein